MRFQCTRNDGSSATRKYPCVSRVRGTLLAAAAPSRTASKSTICDRRRRRGTASARSCAFHCRGKEKYAGEDRSEEHTSELQSLMRISYAVFCLKKKNTNTKNPIVESKK